MDMRIQPGSTSPSEEPSIAQPAHPQVRLLGSRSSQQALKAVARPLRRRDDDDPLPDDDPTPPPPPPPPVSVPDLALQLALCLPVALNGAIIAAVKQALGANADVRTACINGTQRIGVWLRPSVSETDNQARNRGLERLTILNAGESLTFFISATLIRRQALEGWNAAPKRLNHDGQADPNGPIHLTGFALDFEFPNRVVTRVDGFDESPWPDVSFRLTTTDTLSLSGDAVQCASKADLDVDTSWLNFLTGLFLLVLPPLGAVFLVERIIISTVDAPDAGAGAGCGAAAMIPKEILLPGGQKLVMSYSRAEVSGGGIFAGGSFVVAARAPEAFINGLNRLAATEGTASLTRNYSVRTEDLRPGLRFAWSGDGVALSPTAAATAFRFNLAGTAAGQIATRRVAVRVTDADGLFATAELIVRIFVTAADDDGLPPICKSKPWLPQCQIA